MADLQNEMTSKKFYKLATTSITNWWNNQVNLVNKYGQISPDKVYAIKMYDVIRNFKGIFEVTCSSDKLCFKFVYYDDVNRCFLSVYRKEGEIIIKI